MWRSRVIDEDVMTDLIPPNQEIPQALQILLNRPVPELVHERVSAFAYDLAYGWAHGLWDAELYIRYGYNYSEEKPVPQFMDENLKTLYEQKWKFDTPTSRLLSAWGYLYHIKDYVYVISERAQALLEAPVTIPIVFISYKRSVSSTFALALEARLKLIDSSMGVFVDKNINAGDPWHAELQSQVEKCRYFVCLVGPETLNSTYVQKEIEWASADPTRILIPICHAGFTTGDLPDTLQKSHAISVVEEDARAYDIAINDLIHALGYSTV
jgi:hypothetical protein